MTREQQLKKIYATTHRDFKGNINGVKTIMVCRQGGTCIVALSDLTDAEIADRLPKAAK
jgi:hypothetical protein